MMKPILSIGFSAMMRTFLSSFFCSSDKSHQIPPVRANWDFERCFVGNAFMHSERFMNHQALPNRKTMIFA